MKNLQDSATFCLFICILLFTGFIFVQVYRIAANDGITAQIETHDTLPDKAHTQPIGDTKQTMRIFTYANKGEKCRIKQAEKFQIALSETPTTGYVWALSGPIPSNVKIIENTFLSHPKDTQIAGGAGKKIFVFEAMTPGHISLGFTLKRPWEKEDTNADTFAIDLVIE